MKWHIKIWKIQFCCGTQRHLHFICLETHRQWTRHGAEAKQRKRIEKSTEMANRKWLGIYPTQVISNRHTNTYKHTHTERRMRIENFQSFVTLLKMMMMNAHENRNRFKWETIQLYLVPPVLLPLTPSMDDRWTVSHFGEPSNWYSTSCEAYNWQ